MFVQRVGCISLLVHIAYNGVSGSIIQTSNWQIVCLAGGFIQSFNNLKVLVHINCNSLSSHMLSNYAIISCLSNFGKRKQETK